MRIAIVNDMPLAIRALRQVVARDPAHEVAWEVRDGEEAVRMCRVDRPDLILLDLLMPKLDGVEATRRIMADTPCAILIVTAHVESRFEQVYAAMSLGALDAIDMPSLADGKAGDALLAKIARIEQRGHHIARRRDGPPAPKAAPQPNTPRMVALGASTGGPRALADVLSGLGTDLGVAVIIIQHIDPNFAEGLARWLQDRSGFPVDLARTGDRPRPGIALLAATGDHLVVRPDGTLGYTRRPVDEPNRPSVDVFFESAAEYWPRPGVAALLTGMGRDGAEGLLQLRQIGWHTVAQDDATCVVAGMPRAAADIGAAANVLPIQSIGPAIRAYVKAR